MRLNLKKESGITLIALLITIAVIMILGTMTINMTLGNNGFLRNSKEQETAMNKVIKQDEKELQKVENEFLDSL